MGADRGILIEPDGESFRRGIAFKGYLIQDAWKVPVRFRATLGADGEVQVRVRAARMTRANAEIETRWGARGGRFAKFDLIGESASGLGFRCQDTIITGTGGHWSEKGESIAPKVRCARIDFTRHATGETAPPVFRQSLRDFEGRGPMRVTCPLGDVAMSGRYPLRARGELGGYIEIRAMADPPDAKAWLADVRRLCHHVRGVMGFGNAAMLRAPLEQVWCGGAWSLNANSQSAATRTNQPVIHPAKPDDLFQAAVASFFDPLLPVQNLGHALEWFCMSTTYNEGRLLQAMTALETLVDANLPASLQTALSSNRFEKVASSMRDAARSRLRGSAERSNKADEAFLEALVAKMADLNRVTLHEKIMRLAKAWRVPLHDLPMSELSKAIAARNSVVHRGYFYPPGSPLPTERELWTHILLLREVLVRFVLTALGYRGEYLSFRGGQREVSFPPAPGEAED